MISLLLLIFVQSCREPETYRIPEEYKPYIMFDEGTRWVYYDSLNNKNDTIELVSQNTDLEQYTEDPNFYEVLLQHFLFASEDTFFSSSVFYGSRGLYSEYSIDFNEYWRGVLLFENTNYYYETAFFPSKNINDSLYNNVFFCELDYPVGNSDTVRFWWAKNVGMVRSEIFNLSNNNNHLIKLVKTIQ